MNERSSAYVRKDYEPAVLICKTCGRYAKHAFRKAVALKIGNVAFTRDYYSCAVCGQERR